MFFFQSNYLKTAFVLALLSTGIFSWLSLNLLPTPLSAEAPAELFSAERAHAHVRKMSIAPRRLGTTAHQATRDYILNELANLGCEISLQKTYSATAFRMGIFAGPVENIICFFRGKKEDAVLLMSHYDSVHMSPGAGDAASGAAIILESARALATTPRENSLLLLFSDGEENGLLGAAAFVKSQLEKKYKVRSLLNFEARGNSGPFALFETLNFNSINSSAIKTMPRPIGNSFMDFLYQFLPNETDVSIFKSLEIPALNFAFARGLEHYHKSSDTAERLSLESLQHAGDSAMASTQYLLNNSLNSTPSKLLYQDVFGRYHVSYPPIVIKVLSLLLILALLFSLYAWRPSFLKTLLGFFISAAYLLGTLYLTHLCRLIFIQAWSPSVLIIDFYLFFFAFAFVGLCLLHLGFLKIKDYLPEIHFGLILNLCVLLILSFLSTELGTLIVWSSFGVAIYCIRATYFWRYLATIPIAIFLPQFLHSALVADSGTQFVLPVFVLCFGVLLCHILFSNPHHKAPAQQHSSPELNNIGLLRFSHLVALGLGVGLFAYLGYKHKISENLENRAEFFEILSEDQLYVALNKSQKLETLFPQKTDSLKRDFLLGNLSRWRIQPAQFDVFESFSELKHDIKNDYSMWEKKGESTQYLLDIPTQDYECVHILFDPESPIEDIKVNGQSPYPVPHKKFAAHGAHSPEFIESCSLRNIPLRLEFKTAAGQSPLRELLAIFTQNTQSPPELKINPRDTIMSHFSNTLYVLKKIAL